MDHLFMLYSENHEIECLSDGTRSMIIRESIECLTNYQTLKEGDRLFFSRDRMEGEVEASAIVSFIINSGKLTEEESYELIIRNQDRLQLPDDQFYKWAGKPYLLLIGLDQFIAISSNLAETDKHLPFLIPKPQTK